jgi:hypothetical protein
MIYLFVDLGCNLFNPSIMRQTLLDTKKFHLNNCQTLFMAETVDAMAPADSVLEQSPTKAMI